MLDENEAVTAAELRARGTLEQYTYAHRAQRNVKAAD
jgi:hypothetical protein